MKVNGNLIREARVKKGYKQDVLADILGISQSQYSKLENGETAFDIRTLSKLIDELDLNPLEVIEFTDKQQIFINSSMSGNHNNSNSFNSYDEEKIRNIVRAEMRKKAYTTVYLPACLLLYHLDISPQSFFGVGGEAYVGEVAAIIWFDTLRNIYTLSI